MSGENFPLAATAAAVLCSEVLRLPPAMPPPPPISDDGGSDGEAGLGLMIRPRVSRPEDGLDVRGKKVEMGIIGNRWHYNKSQKLFPRKIQRFSSPRLSCFVMFFCASCEGLLGQ